MAKPPKIELKEFIGTVRDEILAAHEVRSADPVFTLTEVSLQVSFSVSKTAGAGTKLWVVEVEGEVATERIHKVTLTLVPNTPGKGKKKIGDMLTEIDVEGLLVGTKLPTDMPGLD